MYGMYNYANINVHVLTVENKDPLPFFRGRCNEPGMTALEFGVVVWHTSKQARLTLSSLMRGGQGTLDVNNVLAVSSLPLCWNN